MADFRSFKRAKRLPAKAMEPVVDPAAWTPESLGGVDDFSAPSVVERDGKFHSGISRGKFRGTLDVASHRVG